MGDLPWVHKKHFTFPLDALRHHVVCLGASGSGKTETLYRCAYGAYKVYKQQVIYLDAKGESKREEEKDDDSAARFVATMRAAGASSVKVFPALFYHGWKGTPTELKNRLLSVIDFSESEYYGDVAANALDLALSAPTTPRNSSHFLANLRYDRLKAIYKNDPMMYERAINLKKDLLAEVKMRYEVFFSAMAGQLDGQLCYEDADAVYLRVRGFTLRKEAPRLGRFLVYDFMHYIAERRRAGVQTLFIIDEFNALRMREETSVLFEQVRSFGGNLIIAAQGYTGLGPREYADRILDATNTYILHSCSNPFPVSKRAGKRFRLDTTWTEHDDETPARRTIRPRWDWKVPENAVMQQEEGQAFWINRGRAQQAQMVQAPITHEQVMDAWEEIRQQEELQHILSQQETQQKQDQHTQTQAQRQVPSPSPANPPTYVPGSQASPPSGARPSKTKTAKPVQDVTRKTPQQEKATPSTNEKAMVPGPQAPIPPIPQTNVPQEPDTEGPDHL